MNINEIEKLVQIIETCEDEAVKNILRKLLATETEKQGMINFPTYPFQTWGMDHCKQCGLKLESTMGYVCSQPRCPTGLGGAWCSSE